MRVEIIKYASLDKAKTLKGFIWDMLGCENISLIRDENPSYVV